MPAAASIIDDALVPIGRFGVALHVARSRSGDAMAALARRSDGRWLPDDLVAVERGERALDDDDIRSLCGLYGLVDQPRPAPSDLDVVLDRAAGSDFSGRSPGLGPDVHVTGDRDGWLRGIATRFAALSVLTGLDVTSGPLGLDVLAEALELGVRQAVELVCGVLADDPASVGGIIAGWQDRVVVPSVGYLVGDAPMGTVVLTGRRGAATGPPGPACGTFAELTPGPAASS